MSRKYISIASLIVLVGLLILGYGFLKLRQNTKSSSTPFTLYANITAVQNGVLTVSSKLPNDPKDAKPKIFTVTTTPYTIFKKKVLFIEKKYFIGLKGISKPFNAIVKNEGGSINDLQSGMAAIIQAQAHSADNFTANQVEYTVIEYEK